MLKYYTLNDSKEVERCDLMQWAEMFEDIKGRTVGRYDNYGILVSTVFLGHDLSLRCVTEEDAPPVCFETCVFGGLESSNVVMRYETYQQAETGHAFMVSQVDELVKNLVRLGSARRAKKFYGEGIFETSVVRDWYSQEKHKAQQQLRVALCPTS